jgi:hypothetical protein
VYAVVYNIKSNRLQLSQRWCKIPANLTGETRQDKTQATWTEETPRRFWSDRLQLNMQRMGGFSPSWGLQRDAWQESLEWLDLKVWVSIVQSAPGERRIVCGMHAVDVFTLLLLLLQFLSHYSIMVYSLLYKPSSFCMHYDLGMEDEFWFGWIHEKTWVKYLSTDIQPTGLSFTPFDLFCLVYLY